MDDEFDWDDKGDSEVILIEEEETSLKKPKMYKVLLHNDNYTTMEFVVFILKNVFHKSKVEALKIMMEVHTKGVSVAGIYTYEVASTNVYLVEKLSDENEYPFRATMEEV